MDGVKNWSSVTWQTKKNLKGFFGKPPVGVSAKAVRIPPPSPAAPKPSVAAPAKAVRRLIPLAAFAMSV